MKKNTEGKDKMMNLKVIAVVPMLMLLVGTAIMPAGTNATTKPVAVQQQQLKDIDAQINNLNSRVDESIATKTQAIDDLDAVKVAVAHGYDREVGLTIVRECKKYGLNTSLILGVIQTESTWINHAPNSCGAMGLMQVTQQTGASLARDLGIEPDLMDPCTNIKLGTYYIACLINKYGSAEAALTAYNRGEGGLQTHIANTGTVSSGYARTVLHNASMY